MKLLLHANILMIKESVIRITWNQKKKKSHTKKFTQPAGRKTHWVKSLTHKQEEPECGFSAST